MPQTRRTQRRRGGAARRGARQQFSQPPSRAPAGYGGTNAVTQPNLYPRVALARTVEGLFNIVCDGINPTYAAINFSLADVPGASEIQSMFQTYCIEKVDIWFRPEYTVLSDASALSNSVNIDFYTSIDLVDSTAPSGVGQVQQYQSCAHTSIVTTHFRRIKPALAIDGFIPGCSMVSTSSANTDWRGLKIAVAATGIPMTFRSIAKYYISVAGLK